MLQSAKGTRVPNEQEAGWVPEPVWTLCTITLSFILYLNQYNEYTKLVPILQGGSNMTGTDFYVNKPHCAAAVRP